MAETITPVVHGGRARWAGAVALHVAGATLTAAVFGAGLGLLGGLLGAPFGSAGAAIVALFALLYLAGALRLVRLPVPQLRRQVPDWWRTFFRPLTTAFLYGAGLGIGFLTFLPNGVLAVVAAAGLASGRPLVGALLVLPFGLARGLSAVVAANVRTQDDGSRLVERLARRSDLARRVVAAMSLTAVVLAAGAAVISKPGAWAEAAFAVVVLAFAWAAAAKIAGRRRWLRALREQGLPAGLERSASWAVPAAEATVVVLGVLGLRRASAFTALVLVVVFTAHVVRLRLAGRREIACGCFGTRKVRDAKVIVARNSLLGAAALIAVARVADAPVLSWPGVPGPGEALPAVLATVGLAAAGIAVWQAGTWLGKGRA